MSDFFACAFGIGTKNRVGEWLEVFFAAPVFRPSAEGAKHLGETIGYAGGNVDIDLDDDAIDRLIAATTDEAQRHCLTAMRGSSRPRVATFLETDTAILTTPEAYLKLHLLSHRFAKPNTLNLDNIYATMPNVAWTSQGAIDISEIVERQLEARARGELIDVTGVDKFPRMVNYVVPSGVRIADASRVRLGAYLGEGSTVMHEGFLNFNAGAMGPNMIEGRISQGVTIDSGTDLGGGASTMGTLSGGGNIVITVGKDCLIGANSGCGIPLGDRCTIESGLYITAGTLVQVLDEHRNFVKVVKARELAGQSDMLFIRNSQTGAVECRTNRKAIQLNESLHSHN
ncbi:MAG TPA: DapH/DapD/GlmU-related protein [Pseudomonadales bacterium]|nr:DapH/DapD/GlmU-related protein [Pseudomonadales bacterium]